MRRHLFVNIKKEQIYQMAKFQKKKKKLKKLKKKT